MATETEKPTPESTGDPKARTRAEVKAKRGERREDRRAAKAEKTAAKEERASEKAAAKEERASEKAAGGSAQKSAGEKKKGGLLPSFKGGTDAVRTLLGQLVWIVAVVCALFLAVGALTQVIGPVDGQNELVQFIRNGAETVSLGLFSRENGVFDFVGVNSSEYNALANYGLGAVLYLVVGRIVDRLVRP